MTFGCSRRQSWDDPQTSRAWTTHPETNQQLGGNAAEISTTNCRIPCRIGLSQFASSRRSETKPPATNHAGEFNCRPDAPNNQRCQAIEPRFGWCQTRSYVEENASPLRRACGHVSNHASGHSKNELRHLNTLNYADRQGQEGVRSGAGATHRFPAAADARRSRP
jgi:hypothetical protein